MKPKSPSLDTAFLLSLTKQDREALADRARLENTSSNAVARAAIRAYLINTSPKRESAAA